MKKKQKPAPYLVMLKPGLKLPDDQIFINAAIELISKSDKELRVLVGLNEDGLRFIEEIENPIE